MPKMQVSKELWRTFGLYRKVEICIIIITFHNKTYHI